MAKVHEKEAEETDEDTEHPDPDLENQFHEDSYPMQDSEIEDFLEHHTSYTVNMASTYHISKHSASPYGSLVDKGANGSLAGEAFHVLERTGRKVSVKGIDDHELPSLDIEVWHSSKPTMARSTCSCMNMLIKEEVKPPLPMPTSMVQQYM